MGNNFSIYLQNYTLELQCKDLYERNCGESCHGPIPKRPPPKPAKSHCPPIPEPPCPPPPKPPCVKPSHPCDERNDCFSNPDYGCKDSKNKCGCHEPKSDCHCEKPTPETHCEKPKDQCGCCCPRPPHHCPKPPKDDCGCKPETPVIPNPIIPFPPLPQPSDLDRIIQLANNPAIIAAMKNDPVALKKVLEMQYGLTDAQFCLLQELILGVPNKLYDLAKNPVIIQMMKKDPKELKKYLKVQFNITECQFNLLRQLILGPTNYDCLKTRSCSCEEHPIGGCAGTQFGCCPDGVTAKADPEGSNCYNPCGEVCYSSVGILPGKREGFYNWNFIVSGDLKKKCPLFVFTFDFTESTANPNESVVFQGCVNGYITYCNTIMEASKYVTYTYNNETKKVEITFHANRLKDSQKSVAPFFMNVFIKHEPVAEDI